MKVQLYGKNAIDILKLEKDAGFKVVKTGADVVISYGGDGTLLSSERKYPGIPKLPIRDNAVCKKCSIHKDKTVLKALISGKLVLEEYKKLQTEVNGKTYYALNDFVLRNSDSTHTIRFKTNLTSGLLIGDGVVVATPFGSTGYYKSITKKGFNSGLGVAFNNITESISPKNLDEKDKVEVELKRGKAVLSYDNNPEIFKIEEGKKLYFKLSGQIAKIYKDTSLRCNRCKLNR